MMTMLIALPLGLLLGLGRSAVGGRSLFAEIRHLVLSERNMVWNPEKEWEHLELILAEVYLVLSLFFPGTGRVSNRISSLCTCDGIRYGKCIYDECGYCSVTNAAAPMYAEQILAYSATSGLLTAVTGVYVEMFLALPLANWYYNRVNPGIEKLRAKLLKKASEEA